MQDLLGETGEEEVYGVCYTPRNIQECSVITTQVCSKPNAALRNSQLIF